MMKTLESLPFLRSLVHTSPASIKNFRYVQYLYLKQPSKTYYHFISTHVNHILFPFLLYLMQSSQSEGRPRLRNPLPHSCVNVCSFLPLSQTSLSFLALIFFPCARLKFFHRFFLLLAGRILFSLYQFIKAQRNAPSTRSLLLREAL